MKKIENFVAQAKKISGEGTIQYCLWVDECGNLYVQFEINNTNTTTPGTFKDLLYSVSQYASFQNSNNAIPNPTGYDINTKTYRISENTNDPGFLKAVLHDLITIK